MPGENEVYRISQGDGAASLRIKKEPIPVPKGNEVLVKIRAVSLNYRDHAILSGNYGLGNVSNCIPCSDMSGEVVEVGNLVAMFKKGDRVTAMFEQTQLYGLERSPTGSLGGQRDGVLAKYRAFPELGLLKIPDDMSYEQAATLPCAGVTSWNALYGGGQTLIPGQTVLFMGTGGVSTMGLVIAQAAGARTIITSSSDEKLVKAKELGAEFGINYRKREDWDVAAKEINGKGVDFLFENGGVATIARSISATRMGGVIAMIGFLGAAQKVTPPDVPQMVLKGGLNLRGVLVGSRQMFEDFLRFVDRKKLKFPVDKIFPFEQAREAYDYLASGGHFGKIVIKVA